jgi:hypothetical protein
MTANILDRYAPRILESTVKSAEETGAMDDFGAFGILRGVRDRSLMLELRFRNGNSVAFHYGYLAQANLDPSRGILLQFGNRRVVLSGSNLNAEVRPNLRLFEAILRHRVPWIRETERNEQLEAAPGSILIDHINVGE